MSVNTIDASLLVKMFLAGAKNLETKKEWINELNVFPVPDGDTGTNMTMTIMSAVKEVTALTEPNMKALSKAISSGSLRGARGNSGVILSQLLRGFTKVVQDYDQVDNAILAKSFVKATETAYKAVMKPKEGTILTVAKGLSDRAVELADQDLSLEDYLKGILDHGMAVLNSTPEMLPVLKEAGVVDSGGQGLMTVLEGAFDAFLGKEISMDFEAPSKGSEFVKISKETEEEIKFGYCTEFIIVLNNPLSDAEVNSFKEYLMSIGDSLVVVADEEITKVHVHTNDPGLAIQRALTYGSLTRMKIDNMREEHQERVIKDSEKLAKQQAESAKKKSPKEWKEYGFISVSVGSGFGEIFNGLNVDCLIEGGQTMNPSTEDMLDAINKVDAKTIYILPNNKNIVMAANQARDLTEDKRIVVIPTKTVPQGIAALISFDGDADVETNIDTMTEAISSVKTGQITYAVRNTSIDGIEIHEGDIMAVGDQGILSVGQSIKDVAINTVKEMVDDDSEYVYIYFGEEFSEEEATELGGVIEDMYPDLEVEVNAGGQPVYYCIISVE